MSLVKYERVQRIVVITMNRPERLNAMSPELCHEMRDAWTAFRDDPDAWVALVNAEGKAFSVGFDLLGGEMTSARAKIVMNILPSFHGVWKPTIAAVQGFCMGGGIWLSMDCDFTIAAENVQFGIPEVKWNYVPVFTAYIRKYMTCPRTALELLLLGEPIDAERAYSVGMINKIVPVDKLSEVSFSLAQRLCQNGPAAMSQTKQLYYAPDTEGLSFEDCVSRGWDLLDQMGSLEDSREGLRAFKEKRKPIFKGR